MKTRTRHGRERRSAIARSGVSSLGVVASGGILAALALGWWVTAGATGDDLLLDPDRIVQVERRDLLDAVTASGRVEPLARVAVMSRASGIIKVLHVDEGDVVETGQILAELDRELLEAQVAQNAADEQSVAARLAATEAAVVEAELQLENPELEFLEREAARQLQLFGQGSVSVKEREDSARALAAARFRIELVRARLPILAAAVLGAQADLASARAALERAETTLREATIRSPIDGVVLVRDKEVGDGVSSILTAGGNATQIMSLGDLSEMHVEARVDEVDLGRIHEGMPAVVTVDAFRGHILEGRVERIAPAGSVDNNGIVTFEVRVAVADPDHLLRPDMTADAKLVIDRRMGSLTLPHRAFRRNDDGTWTVAKVVGQGPDARVEQTTVTIGLSDGLQTEVLTGLDEGDRVLVPESGLRGGRR